MHIDFSYFLFFLFLLSLYLLYNWIFCNNATISWWVGCCFEKLIEFSYYRQACGNEVLCLFRLYKWVNRVFFPKNIHLFMFDNVLQQQSSEVFLRKEKKKKKFKHFYVRYVIKYFWLPAGDPFYYFENVCVKIFKTFYVLR